MLVKYFMDKGRILEGIIQIKNIVSEKILSGNKWVGSNIEWFFVPALRNRKFALWNELHAVVDNTIYSHSSQQIGFAVVVLSK